MRLMSSGCLPKFAPPSLVLALLIWSLVAPGSALAAAEFPAGFEGYHTYAEVKADILAVEAAHPDIVDVFTYGQSHLGRDLLAAKVSDNVADLFRGFATVAAHQRQHRVLHGVERVVLVAQGELRDLERLAFDAREELIQGPGVGGFCGQVAGAAPGGGHAINAAERSSKRRHAHHNAATTPALTRAANPPPDRKSVTYEHS